jgi:hypothetical protein
LTHYGTGGRPRRHSATKQRYELPASHSITSSAVNNSCGGIVKPSALAACKLINQIVSWLLEGQIASLLAAQDAIDIGRSAAKHLNAMRGDGSLSA